MAIIRVRRVFFIAFFIASALFVSHAAGTTIIMDRTKQNDAGWSLAVTDLISAFKEKGLPAAVTYLAPGSVLPDDDLVLVGDMDASSPAGKILGPEAFRIAPSAMPGKRAVRIEGDERGVMYGLFRLAEKVRLGNDPLEVHIETAPAFPLRMFSEEGQLLDIPDFGYYRDAPPYVNELLLRKELEELKRQVDHIVRLGYNTMTVLHMSFEDYIDYRYLDKPIYTQDDPHRKRSPVFCSILNELCEYARARYVDIYLQTYEMQYPPKLEELYGVELDNPRLQEIINAKTREFFERVPLLSGLVITATETAPRCGYKSKMIWEPQGRPGAAKMLTLYHTACKKAGKRCIFRMWRIAQDAAGVREVIAQVPCDAMICIKNTGNDFYLNFPMTDVIAPEIAGKQPLMVVFDTFREFDGWSRLFCCMKRWGDITRACRNSGVIAINGWGSWSPGCIWPDWAPSGMVDGKGNPQTEKVSWIGHWNRFRLLTRGFSPGEVNVYLLGRLAWNPDEDVTGILHDFAELHLGRENAGAAVAALLETEDVFTDTYLGVRSEVTHPVYMKWTMVFGPRPQFMEQAYKNYSLDRLLESNEHGLAAVRRMEKAFSRTSPSYAPDPKRYADFRAAIEKTSLWCRSLFLWRECWWRNQAASRLSGQAARENLSALERVKKELGKCFDEWAKFPEEAGYWQVTFRYGRPHISPGDTFPGWYPKRDETMETSLAGMRPNTQRDIR
jgi:hypothetical protein